MQINNIYGGIDMKKIFVEMLIDEKRLLEMTGMENFHDAFNGELGWLNESGVYTEDWIKVDNDKHIRDLKETK